EQRVTFWNSSRQHYRRTNSRNHGFEGRLLKCPKSLLRRRTSHLNAAHSITRRMVWFSTEPEYLNRWISSHLCRTISAALGEQRSSYPQPQHPASNQTKTETTP